MGKIRNYLETMDKELESEMKKGNFLENSLDIMYFGYSTKDHLRYIKTFCRAHYKASGEGLFAKISTPLMGLTYDAFMTLVRVASPFAVAISEPLADEVIKRKEQRQKERAPIHQ